MAGVAVVIGSVAYIASAEGRAKEGDGREPGRMSLGGFVLAAIGAAGVGAGAVLARRAMVGPAGMDPIVGAVIRIVAACPQLWALALIQGHKLNGMTASLRDRPVFWRLCGGTISGPVLGMFTYVAALGRMDAGLVSTLTHTSPLFVLPMVVWRYRARISPAVYAATAAAVGGVALMSW